MLAFVLDPALALAPPLPPLTAPPSAVLRGVDELRCRRCVAQGGLVAGWLLQWKSLSLPQTMCFNVPRGAGVVRNIFPITGMIGNGTVAPFLLEL